VLIARFQQCFLITIGTATEGETEGETTEGETTEGETTEDEGNGGTIAGIIIGVLILLTIIVIGPILCVVTVKNCRPQRRPRTRNIVDVQE
jgi:hypothetical protein